MTYAYVQVLPGFSAERYEQVVRALGPGPYEGLLAHLAGPCADGWRIIQVWRDADDYARFERSRLWDALAETGAMSGSQPPQFEWLSLSHVVVGGPAEIDDLASGENAS
ncbi:MAG TPA: hypothetical protein VIK95_11610 [Egibacteraceae bacterium]